MSNNNKDSDTVDVAGNVEKNLENIRNPAQISVPHYSSQCAKIEKVETWILVLTFLLPIGMWVWRGFANALVLFFVGVLVFNIYKAKTEVKKFKTKADYELFKQLKKEQTEMMANAFRSQPKPHQNVSDPLKCPKCGSQQIHADKRGFKLGRAVGVGMLTGGIGGVVAGAAGRNKIMVTCLHCGNQWKAGK